MFALLGVVLLGIGPGGCRTRRNCPSPDRRRRAGEARSRFDALAWIGDDYQVWVVYRMTEREEFPAGAERDLRAPLAAGVGAIGAK